MARTLFDEGLDPIALTQARAFLTFGCLALLRPWREPVRRPAAAAVVAMGCAIAAVNASYYLAIERLPVAVAIVIQYTAPALVVAWVSLRRRSLPEAPVLLAVVMAITGVVLAAEVASVSTGGGDMTGIMMGVGTAVAFACYTLLSERVGHAYGSTGGLFRAFGVASLIWLLSQVFLGVPVELVDPTFLPRVLFVGIVGTFVPFLLYVWGIQKVAAERGVIAATLEPPASAVVAWIWLGQALTLLQIAGGVLVIVAVAALQIRGPDRLQPSSDEAGQPSR